MALVDELFFYHRVRFSNGESLGDYLLEIDGYYHLSLPINVARMYFTQKYTSQKPMKVLNWS